MDKIWYRNPSKLEVIGRGGGYEKNEWPRSSDKSRTLKQNTTVDLLYIVQRGDRDIEARWDRQGETLQSFVLVLTTSNWPTTLSALRYTGRKAY